MIRGLGLVLQYNYTGQDARLSRPSKWRQPALAGTIYRELEEMYIPNSGADRLGAGIIRVHRRLGINEYSVGTQQEVILALGALSGSSYVVATLKKALKNDPEFTFPVGDIVAFTSYMICLAGSPLVQVPAPGDNMSGVTTTSSGRRTFLTALLSYIQAQGGPVDHTEHINWREQKVGYRTCWVLWQMRDLMAFDGWMKPKSIQESWTVRRPIEYLKALNQQFDEATNYFAEEEPISSPSLPSAEESTRSPMKYARVFALHIRIMMIGFLNREESDTAYGSNVYESEMMYYFDALPKFAANDEVRRAGLKASIDAWMMMMFRGFCWGACHFFVPGERVPRAYFGSQLPVYIG